MSTTTQITENGTLTLPEEVRRKCGLEVPATVEVEATAEGILIRTVRRYPVETYTEERIAEFEQQNETALREYYSDREK